MNIMKTVYVIVLNNFEFSTETICGIYDNRELALKRCKELRDKYRIYLEKEEHKYTEFELNRYFEIAFMIEEHEINKNYELGFEWLGKDKGYF